jgi:nicotinamidase-related amidase
MTTTFTPENSALLLIDHQVGTMQLIKNIDVEQARRMSLALAKTASILGIPTVLTSSQEDRLQGPLLPEMARKKAVTEGFRLSQAESSELGEGDRAGGGGATLIVAAGVRLRLCHCKHRTGACQFHRIFHSEYLR